MMSFEYKMDGLDVQSMKWVGGLGREWYGSKGDEVSLNGGFKGEMDEMVEWLNKRCDGGKDDGKLTNLLQIR